MISTIFYLQAAEIFYRLYFYLFIYLLLSPHSYFTWLHFIVLQIVQFYLSASHKFHVVIFYKITQVQLLFILHLWYININVLSN